MATFHSDHALFRDAIRKFIASNLAAKIDRWEADCDYPSDIFKELGSQGFLGVLIPEELGGVGGDLALAASWCEEFGRLPSVGFSIAVNMHSLVITPAICRYGTPELKNKWVKGAVKGELIGAYAFTEPHAGSDLSGIQTTAREDGDSFIINGSKIFITNGRRANFILVLAKTDKSAGYGGFTTFVVDTSLPGFSCSKTLSKIGWHASDTAELEFTDLRVPKSAVLGEVGKGWYQAMTSLEWERLMLTLSALGGARSCLEDTIQYTKDRKVFGKSVIEFDHSEELLSTLTARLEAGRAMTYQALNKIIKGERGRKEVSLAKYYVCELAIEIADRCLQLHGGYGYTTEFRPERWLRDLRLNTIGGGTSEIMLKVAYGEMAAVEKL